MIYILIVTPVNFKPLYLDYLSDIYHITAGDFEFRIHPSVLRMAASETSWGKIYGRMLQRQPTDSRRKHDYSVPILWRSDFKTVFNFYYENVHEHFNYNFQNPTFVHETPLQISYRFEY